MLGIIIGAAAALGTVAYCRHRYGRWGHYGHGRGRWGHHGYGRWGHEGYGPGYGGQGCAGPDCGPYERDEAPPWARGGWGRGGPGYGPGYGPGPRGFGRGGFADRWSDMLAWKLEASPEQAEVIRDAFRSVKDELHGLRDERHASLGDLGKALGGERFDEQVMGELFARHDQRLEQLRRALVGALAKIHDVLEPGQRERLAKLIARRGWV